MTSSSPPVTPTMWWANGTARWRPTRRPQGRAPFRRAGVAGGAGTPLPGRSRPGVGEVRRHRPGRRRRPRHGDAARMESQCPMVARRCCRVPPRRDAGGDRSRGSPGTPRRFLAPTRPLPCSRRSRATEWRTTPTTSGHSIMRSRLAMSSSRSAYARTEGSLHLEQGYYVEAIAELDLAAPPRRTGGLRLLPRSGTVQPRLRLLLPGAPGRSS